MWKLCSQVGGHRALKVAMVIGVSCVAVQGPVASAARKAAVVPVASPASSASAPAFKPSPYAAVARQHAQAASATPLTNSLQNLRHQHRPSGQGHQ